ncbi:MAG: Re/Si-specific NAD(P)(+) transhydrogenase subunit alpha [Ottowia sp.]|nr:Re/Si-specific NAD(P)(+) transhydrogenase subunit alpha [Ottowia sp.]
MRIGIPRETHVGETRVAATPETVKKLCAQGHEVWVQSDAGAAAGFFDEAFVAVGARSVSAQQALSAQLVLKVHAPNEQELQHMQAGSALVGMLDPFNAARCAQLAAAGLSAFSLEAAPRTTRAQSMDVLSSQANIAGYKAVILAANLYPRFMPMLMTAAGTFKAARVLILGVGVAGLAAIATAKRLGAVVEASDVRPAAREQVASLGATFIDVPFETDEERTIAQGVGGYARPMPAAWMQRQSVLVAARAKMADIVISTALIPGRTAPTLLSADTVMNMRPGSVVIDLAAGKGEAGAGNCPLTIADQIVVKQGITIVGYTNLPALVPADASALYARNIFDFLKLIVSPAGQVVIPADDDIVKACLISHNHTLLRK